MENKVWRSSKKIIHAIAHCMECDFQEEYFKKASREATKHCRETGHSVAVELGVHYNVFYKMAKKTQGSSALEMN